MKNEKLVKLADDVDTLAGAAKDVLDAFWDMSPLEYAHSRGLSFMSEEEGERIKDRFRVALVPICQDILELRLGCEAMLKEPTDEERKEMLDFLNKAERILGGVYSSIEPNTPDYATENRGILIALRALITAKRTVTLTREQFNLLAGELSATFFSIDHPQVAIDWLEPRLRSLGISIDDKGDVPVINEEGFSNEDRPFKKEKETKHD